METEKGIKNWIWVVVIAIIGLAMLSMPAKAETGSVTVTNQTSVMWTPGGGAPFYNVDWGRFTFANGSFQTLVNFTMSSVPNGDLIFATESDTTTFTCLDGCTGSGVASFSKYLRHLNWVFTPETRIVNNTFNLSYSKNIFVNISTSGNNETSNEVVDATHPIGLWASSTKVYGGVGADHPTYTGIALSTTATNTYNVTYPINGYFNINISKQGQQIPTKTIIHSQTKTYQTETSFNLNDTSFFGQQLDGIYLNVTLSGGAFTDVLLNSSGASGIFPPIPSNINYVAFNISGINAFPNSLYGIDWNIINFDLTTYRYFIEHYDGNGVFETRDDVAGATGTFPRLFTFNTVGNYSMLLGRCGNGILNALCPEITSMEVLASGSQIVLPVSAAGNFSVVTDRSSYQTNQTMLITVTNPSQSDTFLTAFGKDGIAVDIAWNTKAPANSITQLIRPISTALPVGEYTLSLATSESYSPRVAFDTFNITAPSNVSNTLFLGWDDGFYGIGQTGLLTFTTNFNNSNLYIYRSDAAGNRVIDSSTFIHENTTGVRSVALNSPGLWYANLIDENTTSKNVWANTSVLSSNYINGTDMCKQQKTYTCWDKSQYTQGDPFIISYKIELPPFIDYYPTIQIIDPDGNIIRSVKLNYSIWNNTITGALTGSFSRSATTGIWFAKAVQINQITGNEENEITSSATEVISTGAATTTPPTGSTALTSWASNMLSLLNSMFFWGLMLLLGFAITVYKPFGKAPMIGRPDLAVIVFAFLEDVSGLFAPYTVLIFIVLVIIIALSFRKGKEVVTGE